MRHHISLRAAVSATAAVSAAVLLAGMVPGHALASSAQSRVKVPMSPNYAGWLAGSPNRAGTLSANTTFIVPPVSNCTTTDDFVVIGVGLPSATSIIATGVEVGCQGGAPMYTAETDINGVITPIPVTVQPGDKIVLKLSVTGTVTKGSFQDVTQSFKQLIQGKGGKSSGSCIGIDGSEDGGAAGDPPVPDFGKVAFSASTINGQGITASGAVRVNMGTSTGVLQIRTGVVNASGKGFTSAFVNTGG
jgi:hypothetical protein